MEPQASTMAFTTKQSLIADLQGTRREWLQKLADQFGNGGISYIAANIGKPDSYVSRMLLPVGKKGKKPISEMSVIALNQAFPGWMPDAVQNHQHGKIIPSATETNCHEAYRFVRMAIRSGYLPKPDTIPCTDCGSPAQAYDHRDYNRPLDVEPVCHACNAKRGPAIPFVHVNDR